MTSSEAEETGERGAVRALQLSEERFELLVDSVIDYAIFMLDPAGHVTSWNTGAERIKGYAEDEIVGRHFSTFYTDEDRDSGLPEHLLGVARDRGRVENTGWRVRKDGSRFWADVVITALREDDGSLVGFAKVTRDRTEAHRAQAAREDALREQRRLVEKLQELDEWRRGFISSVAHDLQTPVSAIAGFAEIMLTDDVSAEERREFIERIEANANALGDLIEHLRTFASLESGRVQIDPQPLDLRAEIEDVVGGMQPVLGDHRVEVDADDVEVSVDRRGLQRILQNLLTNAARHSPVGTRIRVGAIVEDDTVEIEVEDEGEGIDEELLDVVFERYQRGRGGGTGLGLSIVKQYVELHGGEVGVDTAEGEGSTFRFTLPRA